jgi:hypothetical protein
VAGCCEHGNELCGSIKCGVFLEQVRNLASQAGPWCVVLKTLSFVKVPINVKCSNYGTLFESCQLEVYV